MSSIARKAISNMSLLACILILLATYDLSAALPSSRDATTFLADVDPVDFVGALRFESSHTHWLLLPFAAAKQAINKRLPDVWCHWWFRLYAFGESLLYKAPSLLQRLILGTGEWWCARIDGWRRIIKGKKKGTKEEAGSREYWPDTSVVSPSKVIPILLLLSEVPPWVKMVKAGLCHGKSSCSLASVTRRRLPRLSTRLASIIKRQSKTSSTSDLFCECSCFTAHALQLKTSSAASTSRWNGLPLVLWGWWL